jgi:hypothetical protein
MDLHLRYASGLIFKFLKFFSLNDINSKTFIESKSFLSKLDFSVIFFSKIIESYFINLVFIISMFIYKII